MSPEEDRTRDAVDSEPKHYQLSYSGPLVLFCFVVFVVVVVVVVLQNLRYVPVTVSKSLNTFISDLLSRSLIN